MYIDNQIRRSETYRNPVRILVRGPDSNLVRSVLRIKVPKYWSGLDFGLDNKTIIKIRTALLTSLKIGPFQN